MPAATTRTTAEIKEALARFHGALAPAAHALGISPRTLSRRIKQQPDLALTLDEQGEIVTDIAIGRVIQAIMEKDVEAAKWWLIRKDRSFSLRRVETRITPVTEWPTEEQLDAYRILCTGSGA